jgi:hypothetical protein
VVVSLELHTPLYKGSVVYLNSMASFRDVSKLVIQFTLLSSEHRVPVAQQIGFHSQLFNYSPSDESVVMSHVPNFPFPGY